MDDAAAAKRCLREEMRSLRRRVSPAERAAASDAAVRRLLALYGKFAQETAGGGVPQAAAVYLATPEELDIDTFATALAKRGVAVYAPRYDGKTYALARLRGFADGELRKGPMGVREPVTAETVPPSAIGFWAVPGLAFSRDGARLGYGGGWYDRLLAEAHPRALKAAVAYPFQIIPHVPASPHDIPVDEIC